MIAYGLTNVPIGNAYLSGDPYYGIYTVFGLGSNGTDGCPCIWGNRIMERSFHRILLIYRTGIHGLHTAAGG